MAKLRKFTLQFDEKKDKWALGDDQTNRTLKTFKTKDEATQGGVLKKTLGQQGGSVKIKKKDGRIQEERTFPSSADPHKSPG